MPWVNVLYYISSYEDLTNCLGVGGDLTIVGRVETMPKSDELHRVIELWKETSVWTRESEFS